MRLTEGFNLLATAPDGIKRLRELILSLAVQGKLVPQDPADEPASELLKQIRTEKERLIAEKKIRKGKELPAIDEAELNHELPIGWEWARLGNLGDWGAGATPSRSNTAYYGGEIPWFKSGELIADYIDQSEEKVTELALEECSLRLNNIGDVLIAMYGATIGKTAILNVVGTTNQAVCACTPFSCLERRYLLLVIKALKLHFIGLGAGGAQPNISREKIIGTVIGLPPLAEQTRIVAKVEELMELCDELEIRGQLEAEQHTRLTATLFDALAASESAHQLQENWGRLAASFDLVLDRPQAVDALEQTILQLAVRGLLVPQNPTDEPASELLKQIRAEKDRLILDGKIKKDKPLPAISDEEKPFDLPQGWEWTRAGTVFDFLNGYAFKSEWFQTHGIRLLRNINIAHGIVDWSQSVCLEVNRLAEFKRFELQTGDLVLTLDRPIISTGLKYAVIQDEDVPCLLLQRVARLAPILGSVNTKFTELWLNSELFISSIDPGRSNGVPHISTKQIEVVLLPLPPLAEQSRIVARVEALRVLCDQLRERLSASRQTQAHLAEALVSQM